MLVHRDWWRPHRPLPSRDDSGATIELGLLPGDLASQVRTGLSQPVRATRNPAHHRCTSLGAAHPVSSAARTLGAGASSRLRQGLQLGGCRRDPGGSPRRVGQARWHTAAAAVVFVAGVIGCVGLVCLGEDLGHLRGEPVAVTVGLH